MSSDNYVTGELVLAMVGQGRAATDQLIGNLQYQAHLAQAELAAVRARVGELLSGDYMPSSERLALALHPSAADIERYMPIDGES